MDDIDRLIEDIDKHTDQVGLRIKELLEKMKQEQYTPRNFLPPNPWYHPCNLVLS